MRAMLANLRQSKLERLRSLHSLGRGFYVLIIGTWWSMLALIVMLFWEAMPNGIQLSVQDLITRIGALLLLGLVFGSLMWWDGERLLSTEPKT